MSKQFLSQDDVKRWGYECEADATCSSMTKHESLRERVHIDKKKRNNKKHQICLLNGIVQNLWPLGYQNNILCSQGNVNR